MSDQFDRKEHIRKHKERIKKEKTERKSHKKPVEKKPNKIDPLVLRHQLVVEYNRLIREGNPDTKKLREQIHAEIQKIENKENDTS